MNPAVKTRIPISGDGSVGRTTYPALAQALAFPLPTRKGFVGVLPTVLERPFPRGEGTDAEGVRDR
jgi:hypothetical protein